MKLYKNEERNLKKQTKTSVYMKLKLKYPLTNSLKIEVQL